MIDSQVTLNQFFLRDKDLSARKVNMVESSEGLAQMKARVTKQIGAPLWKTTLRELINKVDDLLDIKIKDIMLSAWSKYGALRKYADKGKYPPEKTVLIHLAEHTIKSAHKPFIDILVNETKVGKVHFEITLALTFKGIILKIREGKITEIQTGTCTGKGTIKCENVLIFDRKTAPFLLPGVIHVGEATGIR